MTDSKDKRVSIVTMRVADSPPSPASLGASTQMSCDLCGEACWITETTFPKMVMYPDHRIVCNVCIAAELITEDIEKLDIRTSDPQFHEMLELDKKGVIEWMIKRGLG